MLYKEDGVKQRIYRQSCENNPSEKTSLSAASPALEHYCIMCLSYLEGTSGMPSTGTTLPTVNLQTSWFVAYMLTSINGKQRLCLADICSITLLPSHAETQPQRWHVSYMILTLFHTLFLLIYLLKLRYSCTTHKIITSHPKSTELFCLSFLVCSFSHGILRLPDWAKTENLHWDYWTPCPCLFFLSIFNTQQKNIIRAGRWLQSSQLQLKKPFYKNHSELSALLGQRLPHLAPNPQGRKGKEETKIVLLRSLNRNTGAELGSVTRDVVLHMKN